MNTHICAIHAYALSLLNQWECRPKPLHADKCCIVLCVSIHSMAPADYYGENKNINWGPKKHLWCKDWIIQAVLTTIEIKFADGIFLWK